jgi:hypothetical protein
MFLNPVQRIAVLGAGVDTRPRLTAEGSVVSVVSARPCPSPRLTDDGGIITAEARVQ